MLAGAGGDVDDPVVDAETFADLLMPSEIGVGAWPPPEAWYPGFSPTEPTGAVSG